MGEPDLKDNAAPPFLIELVEPIGYPRRAQVFGDKGARGLSAYHMVESVAHIVAAPLRYQVFYTSAETTPDVLTHVDSGEFRVVSQRLREVLEPWLKDYEFIPIHIELSPTDGHEETDDEDYSPQLGGGPVLENYWWLNCWRRLDLVDWEHSDIDMGRPPADSTFAQSPVCAAAGWKRLALKAPPPEDEHYFGLVGIRGRRQYISPKLHQHLLTLGLKVRFAPRFVNAGAWASTVEVTDKLNLGRQFSVF